MGEEAAGRVADGFGGVLDQPRSSGRRELADRHHIAEYVTVFLGHGKRGRHRGEHTAVERMGVHGGVALGVREQEFGVYALLAGGLVGTLPLEGLHVHDRHLLGLQHLVVERGRRGEHLLVVETHGDVAPGALHEILLDQPHAGGFDLLGDLHELVGDYRGRLLGELDFLALFRCLLARLVLLGVLERVADMLDICADDAELLGAALLLGEKIAGHRLVEHQRRGVDLGECPSGDQRAGVREEAGVAEPGERRDHFDRGVLERGAHADAHHLRHVVKHGRQGLTALGEGEYATAVHDGCRARLFLGFERAQEQHRSGTEVAVDLLDALLGHERDLFLFEVGEFRVGRGDVKPLVRGHADVAAVDVARFAELGGVLFDVLVDLLIFHHSSPSNLFALALM